MIIIYAIAGIYMIMFITWLFYLAIMNISRIRKTAGWEHKIFAYPMLFIGLPLDFLFDKIVGSLIFLEMPKELLFTGRCQRHKANTNLTDWRRLRAIWWCDTYLNPFDPTGRHC